MLLLQHAEYVESSRPCRGSGGLVRIEKVLPKTPLKLHSMGLQVIESKCRQDICCEVDTELQGQAFVLPKNLNLNGFPRNWQLP